MIYEFPPGKTINDLDFSQAVEIRKSYRGFPGSRIYTQRNMPPSTGYPAPQWGSGKMGNMNANWRRRLGKDFEETNKRHNARWSRR